MSRVAPATIGSSRSNTKKCGAACVTHSAVLERPDLLQDEKLVDGLVRMWLGYLIGDASERRG